VKLKGKRRKRRELPITSYLPVAVVGGVRGIAAGARGKKASQIFFKRKKEKRKKITFSRCRRFSTVKGKKRGGTHLSSRREGKGERRTPLPEKTKGQPC